MSIKEREGGEEGPKQMTPNGIRTPMVHTQRGPT